LLYAQFVAPKNSAAKIAQAIDIIKRKAAVACGILNR
jgi:hypothetical protein